MIVVSQFIDYTIIVFLDTHEMRFSTTKISVERSSLSHRETLFIILFMKSIFKVNTLTGFGRRRLTQSLVMF